MSNTGITILIDERALRLDGYNIETIYEDLTPALEQFLRFEFPDISITVEAKLNERLRATP